mgnify:FL=1
MDSTTTQLYISLLENTNQQLSLWSNPYGVLVAILSFLVAFLAIAAAFILFRQTREYRELFQNALKDYQNALQKNIEKIGLDAETKIQLFIDSKTKEIDTLSGDTKKQAKKIIDDLKNEKSNIGSRIQFASIEANQFKPLVFTPQVDNILNVNRVNTFPDVNRIDFLNRNNYCPKCGNSNGEGRIIMATHKYCSNCGNKL